MKIFTKIFFFTVLVIEPFFVYCQKMDNTASFRSIQSEGYFRFHYDNDFFSATDQYYTQGINLELVSPSLNKFPLSKLLLHFNSTNRQYGLSVEHNAFSPSSIRHPEILFDDYPFAACIMLKTFVISFDSTSNSGLSSVFTIGAIGPVAFGEWMQKSIHKWLKNIEPLGWENQIHNDVIINYNLSYQKHFFKIRNIMSFNMNTQIDVGTLKDHLKIGFTTLLGKFNNVFDNDKFNNYKFQFYLYSQPFLSFVGYDATLQGGLFNRSSPYTLGNNEISRIIFENNFGAVFSFRKLFLEYFQAVRTKEFRKGKFHRWGGVKIGVSF